MSKSSICEVKALDEMCQNQNEIGLVNTEFALTSLELGQVIKGSHTSPTAQFFNIVQTAFDSPPPRFEHVCCKFFWTTF